MRVLFDSNVFLKYLAGFQEAKALVDKVEDGEWEGYINDIVVSEVIYGYLRLSLNMSRYKLRKYIIKNNNLVRELLKNDIYPLLSIFKLLPLNLDVYNIIQYIAEYGLLPNDALIAATYRIYDIDLLATFDNDFRRIPWIKVVP